MTPPNLLTQRSTPLPQLAKPLPFHFLQSTAFPDNLDSHPSIFGNASGRCHHFAIPGAMFGSPKRSYQPYLGTVPPCFDGYCQGLGFRPNSFVDMREHYHRIPKQLLQRSPQLQPRMLHQGHVLQQGTEPVQIQFAILAPAEECHVDLVTCFANGRKESHLPRQPGPLDIVDGAARRMPIAHGLIGFSHNEFDGHTIKVLDALLVHRTFGVIRHIPTHGHDGALLERYPKMSDRSLGLSLGGGHRLQVECQIGWSVAVIVLPSPWRSLVGFQSNETPYSCSQ